MKRALKMIGWLVVFILAAFGTLCFLCLAITGPLS